MAKDDERLLLKDKKDKPNVGPKFVGPNDKSKGGTFIIFVYLWMAGAQASYLITSLLPIADENPSIFRLTAAAVVTITFVLFLIAFIKANVTDPGRVPPHYGFYLGDETKRRRYCHACHVWKPERTFHCKACNRCVLQYDHHCVWINNCVGFYNRKFFIQLLTYCAVWLAEIFLHGVYTVWKIGYRELYPRIHYGGEDGIEQAIGPIIKTVCVIINILSAICLLPRLLELTANHYDFLLFNSTSVENVKGTPKHTKGTPYDLGKRRNVEQNMGPKPWLWWWPCHTGHSRPIGDGVRWRQDYSNLLNNDQLESGKD